MSRLESLLDIVRTPLTYTVKLERARPIIESASPEERAEMIDVLQERLERYTERDPTERVKGLPTHSEGLRQVLKVLRAPE